MAMVLLELAKLKVRAMRPVSADEFAEQGLSRPAYPVHRFLYL